MNYVYNLFVDMQVQIKIYWEFKKKNWNYI